MEVPEASNGLVEASVEWEKVTSLKDVKIRWNESEVNLRVYYSC